MYDHVYVIRRLSAPHGKIRLSIGDSVPRAIRTRRLTALTRRLTALTRRLTALTNGTALSTAATAIGRTRQETTHLQQPEELGEILNEK